MSRSQPGNACVMLLIVGIALAVIPLVNAGTESNPPKVQSSASAWPPGSPEVIRPQELAKVVQSSTTTKPIILNVGPRVIYVQAHIPGAVYVGQTASPEGLEQLRKRAASLPRDSSIVIYCGCCPWEHCPNVRPAYQELKQMRFTRVKVLYITNTFGSDWVEKGYPTAKGE